MRGSERPFAAVVRQKRLGKDNALRLAGAEAGLVTMFRLGQHYAVQEHGMLKQRAKDAA